MTRWHDRKLWAYRDGELSDRARERMRRRLEEDPDLAGDLGRLHALGMAVRESWSEGPSAPAPELVVQVLRPEMARIDDERAPSLAERLRGGLGALLAPARLGSLAAGMAGILLLVLAGLPGTGDRGAPQGPGGAGLVRMNTPRAIYALDQGEKPLLVYEDQDGETVIWMLDDLGQGQISGDVRRRDRRA